MWNSTGYFVKVTDEMKKESAELYKNFKVGEWITQGNATEQGILRFFQEEYGAEGCISKKEEVNSITETKIKFESKRKQGSIIVKTPNGYRVYCKGAPDMLIPKTTHIVDASGSVVPINSKMNVDPSLLSNKEQG